MVSRGRHFMFGAMDVERATLGPQIIIGLVRKSDKAYVVQIFRFVLKRNKSARESFANNKYWASGRKPWIGGRDSGALL